MPTTGSVSPFTRSFSATEAAIADATITVIARDGFDRVSVRTVAAQSRLAPGTVQYHARTRQALLTNAFIRSVQRQNERVLSLSSTDDPLEALHLALSELLPTADVRREDASLWVAYGAAASTRPWLAELYWEAIVLFRSRLESALEVVRDSGHLRPGVSPSTGARLVTALVNGLTIDHLNAPEAERGNISQDLRHGLAHIVC
ncbi:TetR/AcrR family transcriptional regulator [Actinomyces ruminicola]|uniref:Transcriptional regulator, TetR family n=1 Tax=Actinomyces ruminicola TaxID=332524 RepID=A0A1G9UPE9_9ACTO|nr:TetR family transcriptional regulator C-terminal domain-containing protein [Actinomyces ruminicola]SDM61724.1 transcriptional regulator, TetR family [Actinomyces ruminicola]